ncbi:MAG: potassium/proton antiporter, partial [Mycobacteriaceae bacterium]
MTERLDLALLVGAAVVLVGVVAVRLSLRLGLPSLLLYLGIGLAMGESGIGLEFEDADLARTLGLAALVVILAEGGLTSRWDATRPALPLAVLLATLGVAVTVSVVAVAAWLALGLDLRTALLYGAVVASTDAAAVFSTLRSIPLPKRIVATLEAESGTNDPLVVIVVVLLSSQDWGTHSPLYVIGLVVFEIVAGPVVGLATGFVGVVFLRRAGLPASGLYPLATLALAVLAYAGAASLHASGFLAVYLAALALGNAELPYRPAVRAFAEGMATLAQIGVFVMLGLLASPSRLPGAVLPALAIGAVLLVVARPLAVFV